MKPNLLVEALLLSLLGCTSPPSDQLTVQQKDQIKNEIKTVCDSIIGRVGRVDPGWIDYFSDSPEWGMVNADGSRWEYQTLRDFVPEWAKVVTACRWSTTRQDFIFLTNEIVICAWDGTDETFLTSGDKITFSPHAYTMIFRRVAGEWRVIYSHDSGTPVTQKAKVE